MGYNLTQVIILGLHGQTIAENQYALAIGQSYGFNPFTYVIANAAFSWLCWLCTNDLQWIEVIHFIGVNIGLVVLAVRWLVCQIPI